MQRRGYIALQSWAGYKEYPVEIVGETATRYRVRAIGPMALPGRGRTLQSGETTLVPKHRVYGLEPADEVGR